MGAEGSGGVGSSGGLEDLIDEEGWLEEVEEVEEEEDDEGRGGQAVLDSKSCVDADDEVDGGFGLLTCCDRDACHRLSRKSCVKFLIMSGLRLAFALIKAT